VLDPLIEQYFVQLLRIRGGRIGLPEGIAGADTYHRFPSPRLLDKLAAGEAETRGDGEGERFLHDGEDGIGNQRLAGLQYFPRRLNDKL
jgi:hypothetical protein